jgi:hypothetical protein
MYLEFRLNLQIYIYLFHELYLFNIINLKYTFFNMNNSLSM